LDIPSVQLLGIPSNARLFPYIWALVRQLRRGVQTCCIFYSQLVSIPPPFFFFFFFFLTFTDLSQHRIYWLHSTSDKDEAMAFLDREQSVHISIFNNVLIMTLYSIISTQSPMVSDHK